MDFGIIYGFFYKLTVKSVYLYRQSSISKAMSKIADFLKSMFVNSAVWKFFARRDSSNRAFKASSTVKGINFVLALPVKGAAWVLRHSEGSLTDRLFKLLTPLFTFFTAVFIFVHTVIPHVYWKNIYSLGMILALYLLYVFKCAQSYNDKLKAAAAAAQAGGNTSREDYRCDIGRLDIAIFLFILAMVLGTVTSIALTDSVRVFLTDVAPLIFVFLFANAIKTRREFTTIMHAIIFGVTVASVYGIYQYVTHVPVDPKLVDISVSGSVVRIFGSMGNPNNYAEYLVLCLPFYAAAFLNSRTERSKIFIGLLSALPLLNLILTSSRSSWIGLMAAVMVFLFLKKRKVIPLVILAGLIGYQFLPDSITARVASIGKDSSSKLRLEIWDASFKMLKNYWVTGLGTGPKPFMTLFERYTQTPLLPHSHMLPLQIWLEFGLAGIVSFLWMLLRLVKRGMDNIFKKRDPYYDNIAAAAISALAGIMVIGMFEYVWFYPRVMGMFWIVIAIFLTALNATADIK